MTNYDTYMALLRKWDALRMRMVRRCVAHGVDAYRYRNAVATPNGLIINNELVEI